MLIASKLSHMDTSYLFIYYVIFTQEYPISAQHCSPWGSCIRSLTVRRCLVVAAGVWAGVVAGTTYAPQGPAFKPNFPMIPSRSFTQSSPRITWGTRFLDQVDTADNGITEHFNQSQSLVGSLRDETDKLVFQSHKLNLKCGTEPITETANEDAASRVSFSVDSSDDNDRTFESDDGVGLTSQSSPDVTPLIDRLVCPKCGTTVTDGHRRSPASTMFKPMKRPGVHTRKTGNRWMKGKRLGDVRQTPYARSKSDETPSNRVATEARRKMRKTVSASGGQKQKHGDGISVKSGDNAFADAIKSVAKRDARKNHNGMENQLRNGTGNVSGEVEADGGGVTPLVVPKRRRRRRRKKDTQGEGTGLESSLNSVSVYGGNPKWSWK